MFNLNAQRRRTAARRTLALLALAAAPALRADDGAVTVLEPVFVEATTGDPWEYFTVPGFEVISHCPDDFNRTYARALQRSTAARLAVLPAGFWGDMPTPVKIVLYDRPPEKGGGFNRGNPIDLSWEQGSAGESGSERIVHSYPVTVGDGDTYINCGNYWSVQTDSDNFSVDPDSDIRLQHRVPRLPAWFEAGMEGQFGLFRDRIIRSSAFSESVVLPGATWISLQETLEVANWSKEKHRDGKAFHPRDFLPLADLLNGAAPPGRRELWNSEAALLVRWGLFASPNRQAFLDYVDGESREPATEALFRRHFGFGYAEAQALLGAYLPKAVGEPVSVPLPQARPWEPRIREATSAEVARIVGDWGRLEGRSLGIANLDYQRECLDQAEKLFERVRLRRTSDPMFLAAYGLYEIQSGDGVKAREALEDATSVGVLRPRAYVELANLRLDEALPSVQHGIGDLNAADYAAITGLLTTARVQMPSLLATYDVLARALEHAPARPTAEELQPLYAALGLFPRNAALAYKVANLCREEGYAEKADQIIDRARGFSDSDEGRALLREFAGKPGRDAH